jgi:hypothetical protein
MSCYQRSCPSPRDPKKKHSVVIVPAPERPVYAGVSLAHCSAAAQVAVATRERSIGTSTLVPVKNEPALTYHPPNSQTAATTVKTHVCAGRHI